MCPTAGHPDDVQDLKFPAQGLCTQGKARLPPLKGSIDP